ncbi:MAG: MerC domain-containing protein [Pseudomonadales bacterium]|nr:MerC domain-containing protein [Pseudomonadales bacterium]MCP5183517.1 MerC domain-containing protein [Pseudomonadales bacterium]
MKAPGWFDRGAVGVSLLCMVHCLLLPLLAVLFPLGVFATLAENHWHWLFLALAAPLSILAVLRLPPHARNLYFIGGASCGITLLTAGVLTHEHVWQVALSVAGAICLACAHLYNLYRLRHSG